MQVPDRLNAEAKELLRQFDAVTGNTLKTNGDEKPKKKKFGEKIKESIEDLIDGDK